MKWWNLQRLVCVTTCLILCGNELQAIRPRTSRLSKMANFGEKLTPNGRLIVSMSEAKHMIEDRLRQRRASSDDLFSPKIHGNYSLDDNEVAAIHYSGSDSPVILVLTFSRGNDGSPFNVHFYRSTNYGQSFDSILGSLNPANPNPTLWTDFFVSPINKNLVIIPDANQPRFYYSKDEGESWNIQQLTPNTINPRSLLWNSVNDRMALAHNIYQNQLFVTRDLGASWTKIADFVAGPNDYQWGDPSVDVDPSVVYFNTYNPDDVNRNNFTVSLQTQRVPYTASTLKEFDPSLGRHDAFLLLGPYIFAQKTEQGNIHLYISYNRQPFQQAMIPSTDPHQNYIVSHINRQQALVIVEHQSGRFNLYLSDITGRFFSMSLPDIVITRNGLDLEVIEGVNGTLVANQYVRTNGNSSTRTLISLDNGGNWELVRSPASANCAPPQCSLHFHMSTTEYARTGVYSQASAPGLILAHGNTGSTLNSDSPDLYISRDAGVSWSLTLQGSWGVTVMDHGGLLVAARDYHQVSSTELRYSCNEGISWNSFNFVNSDMTVYGVITEPGEHTTTVSMYGTRDPSSTWSVVTVNFSSIFPSTCPGSAYYYWQPWDDRSDANCILGSSVTIERRNASICCLIGQDYSRPVQFSVCPCYEDDFECDYGYKRTSGLTGPCEADESIILPDPCEGTSGNSAYKQSQGYRKVAGDVCKGGDEGSFAAVDNMCFNGDQTAIIALSILFAVALLLAILFAVLLVLCFCGAMACGRGGRSRRSVPIGEMSGTRSRVQFQSDTPASQPLVTSGTEDDDDDPLAL